MVYSSHPFDNRYCKPLEHDYILNKSSDISLSYKMSSIIRRMETNGVRYMECKKSFMGNSDFGRYSRLDKERFIFVVGVETGNPISEVVDTIIHESIHFAGEQEILNRNMYSPIDRNSLCYLAEEYIALKATNEICQKLGVYNMVPPPSIGDSCFDSVNRIVRSLLSHEGLEILEEFCQAAIENVWTGTVNNLGRLDSKIKQHIKLI